MLLAERNHSTERVFLAAVPLLFAASGMRVAEALSAGVNIAGLFWATALFFGACCKFFPPRFRQAAYAGWLAVLAQSGYIFFGLTPFFILSIALLMPAEIFDMQKGSRAFQRAFLRGVFFTVLLVYVAAFQDLLGGRLLIWTFKTPAGAFLLLAAAAFLWKNQPDANPAPGRRSDG